ncbi:MULTISPECIES: OmpA family protein [unclassified Pseudomonas]|uniref:OmpA/MotB family protein n=1 Tax=unclassified Pseudomonas TaxID=196821 RepID=UPI0006B8F634|nr:OmpA family protein [Pseudomonas sp.]
MNGSARRNDRFARWHVEPRGEEEQEGWLLTYLDMITLLLVMLVVMLAFAGQGDGATRQSGAARAPEGQAPLVIGTPQPSDEVQAIAALAPAPPLPEQAREPAPVLPDLGEDIEVIVNEGSISFRISSEILFGSGQAELEEAGFAVLDRLIPTLAATSHRIIVEGHTDDLPIQTPRFPSNWELSASRASSVVRYLQVSGIAAARMSATGYAETRPLRDNASDQGRAGNRRVELVMQTQPPAP